MATSKIFSFPGVVRGGASSLPKPPPALDIPRAPEGIPARHPAPRHVSSPSETLQSPLRHHQRAASVGRPPIRETLDACLTYSDDEDGGQEVRINQYTIKQEIGRGSFGAVHLAEDQDGQQYAMKEFSKSRLRKRSQSHILRRPHAARRRGGLLGGLNKQFALDIHNQEEAGNPLFLIQAEIAILKKLDHENVARLIEVLDDPEGDSLYIVLEMCEKGVIMKVGLDETADPYPEDKCRLWFRDMILGIEYLHSQGVVHRDIKPDNLLLSKDDVLKIVDFGVSEMFEKKSVMMTAKSAGSPAFLPPELCVAGHGDISGTAADIWSMGVTLYCLLFGRLPFNHSGVMELYEAIKYDKVFIPNDANPDLADILEQIFQKDPSKRIKMPELREHPWVTCGGLDSLLPASENTADFIPAPTDEEMASAITGGIRNVMAVVRAVHKLKRLTLKRFKSPLRSSNNSSSSSLPTPGNDKSRSRSSLNISRGRSMESVICEEPPKLDSSAERDTEMAGVLQDTLIRQDDRGFVDIRVHPSNKSLNEAREIGEALGRGQAVSPLTEESLFLKIGMGCDQSVDQALEAVSESPTVAGEDVYEEAYWRDAERIRQEQGQEATVYLTKWVEER